MRASDLFNSRIFFFLRARRKGFCARGAEMISRPDVLAVQNKT